MIPADMETEIAWNSSQARLHLSVKSHEGRLIPQKVPEERCRVAHELKPLFVSGETGHGVEYPMID